MKKMVLAVAVSAALVLGARVVAQNTENELEAGKHWLALMNHKGDTDKTISKQEFDRYMNEQFDQADTDHDGTLDARELGHLRATLIAK